jgi:hypothetical protein
MGTVPTMSSQMLRPYGECTIFGKFFFRDHPKPLKLPQVIETLEGNVSYPPVLQRLNEFI